MLLIYSLSSSIIKFNSQGLYHHISMGACFSTPAHLLEVVDGDEAAYKERYREDKVLGEGEYSYGSSAIDWHVRSFCVVGLVATKCRIDVVGLSTETKSFRTV